jgi:hypothetical protein
MRQSCVHACVTVCMFGHADQVKHTYVHVQIAVCAYAFINAYIRDINIYIHTYIHTYIRSYTHAYVHTYIQFFASELCGTIHAIT